MADTLINWHPTALAREQRMEAMAKRTYTVAWIDKIDRKFGKVIGRMCFAKRKDAEAFFATVDTTREPTIIIDCLDAPARVLKPIKRRKAIERALTWRVATEDEKGKIKMVATHTPKRKPRNRTA